MACKTRPFCTMARGFIRRLPRRGGFRACKTQGVLIFSNVVQNPSSLENQAFCAAFGAPS